MFELLWRCGMMEIPTLEFIGNPFMKTKLEEYCDELKKEITESGKCNYTEQEFEACNANELKEWCLKNEKTK